MGKLSKVKTKLKKMREGRNPLARGLAVSVMKLYEFGNFILHYGDRKNRSVASMKLFHGARVQQTTQRTWENRYPEDFAACRDYFAGKEASELRILSYGCCTGEEVISLRDYFPEATIVGAEINAESLRVCKSRKVDGKIHFVKSVPRRIRKLGPYDAIFCMAVLQRTPHVVEEQHITDISELYPFEKYDKQIKELDSYLKEDGMMILQCSQYDILDSCVGNKYEVYGKCGYDFLLFDRQSRLAAEKGFRHSMFRKRLLRTILGVMLVFTLSGCRINNVPVETTPGGTTPVETAQEGAGEDEQTKDDLSYTKVREQYDPYYDQYLGGFLWMAGEEKDYPIVHIYTQDREKILSKDSYLPAVIDVTNCREEMTLSANAGVKVRGNSTADQGDEKPYRIRFEEKHNMLGLHDGREYRSWVLLRSYWNLAPDYTGFSLAHEIFADEYYCSDFQYVNLYINAEYRGIYLLCEQNQAAEGRFSVNEPSKKAGTRENVRAGYLMELDNYPNAEEHFYFSIDPKGRSVTDVAGITRELNWKNYSVRSDIYTKAQKNFISTYVSGVFDILYEASLGKPMMFDEKYHTVSAAGTYDTAYEAVDAVIDTKSLANMLILSELVQDNDVGAGSFYMAVDFSLDSIYPKLTFCGPWDFNWAYEKPVDAQYYACTFQDLRKWGDNSNYWYILAMKIPEFEKLVQNRWQEIGASNLRQVCETIDRKLVTLENDLGKEDSWRINSGKNVVEYVRGRIRWLDARWAAK